MPAGSLEVLATRVSVVLLLPLGQCLGGAGPDLVPAAGARLESSVWAVSAGERTAVVSPPSSPHAHLPASCFFHLLALDQLQAFVKPGEGELNTAILVHT